MVYKKWFGLGTPSLLLYLFKCKLLKLHIQFTIDTGKVEKLINKKINAMLTMSYSAAKNFTFICRNPFEDNTVIADIHTSDETRLESSEYAEIGLDHKTLEPNKQFVASPVLMPPPVSKFVPQGKMPLVSVIPKGAPYATNKKSSIKFINNNIAANNVPVAVRKKVHCSIPPAAVHCYVTNMTNHDDSYTK